MPVSRCSELFAPHGLAEIWKEIHTSTVHYPLGPYHPVLSQPFQLTLHLRGETVEAVDPVVTGFCGRGILNHAAGRSLTDVLTLLEHACATAHESHRLAFCLAVEKLATLPVDPAAQKIRVLFAELERALARLWTLYETGRAVGLHAVVFDALDQREVLFTALKEATGERVYWSVAEVGGVRSGVTFEALRSAVSELNESLPLWRGMADQRGTFSRIGENVGTVSAALAAELGLTGVAARGSAAQDDLRLTQPYSGYADNMLGSRAAIPTLKGDVASRLAVVVADLENSIATALALLETIESSPSVAPVALPKKLSADTATAAVEGPHGAIRVSVRLKAPGTVVDVRLETPAEANLRSLPAILESRPLTQVPVVLASLDLCPACSDL